MSTRLIKGFFTQLLSSLHDILFPKHCVGCRGKGTYLCIECEKAIPIHPTHTQSSLSVATIYSHPMIRELVKLLKYKGVREIASIFASWIYEILLEEISEHLLYREQRGKIIIIPIPLSAQRFRQRGYNQAEEIGRELVTLDPKIFELEVRNLVKIKETPTQVSVKSRTDRLRNLRGAFAVLNQKKLRGKTILLIDDVTTTGTTLEEAAKALIRAKPKHIIKVAVAG